MKKSALFVSFFLAILFFAAPLHVEETKYFPGNVVEHAVKSTVKITVSFSHGITAYGSGVILNKHGLIRTAWHVIHAVNLVPESLRVILYNGHKHPAIVVKSTLRDDYALIQMVGPLDNLFPSKSALELPANKKVFTVGYPHGNMVIIFGKILNEKKYTAVNGMPTKKKFLTIIINKQIKSGHSGGPLFNKHGEVVGIAIGAWKKEIQSCFVPTQKIIKTIDKQYLLVTSTEN